MTVGARDTEKLRKIVALLAGVNCGKCGFENCGKFAVALVDGKAAPIDCRKSLAQVPEISELLGVPVPDNLAQITEEHKRRHAEVHGHHGHGPHGEGRHGHHGHGGGKGNHGHAG